MAPRVVTQPRRKSDNKEQTEQTNESIESQMAELNNRWTEEEKYKIMEAYGIHGLNFHALAEFVSTKTPAQCRNYYLANKKRFGFEKVRFFI